jgi:hypothetical protein
MTRLIKVEVSFNAHTQVMLFPHNASQLHVRWACTR